MQEVSEQQPIRPELLTVLCILTFIGSGMSFLANGFMYLTIDQWQLAYQEGMFDMFEGQLEMDALEMLLNVNPLFYLIQAVLYCFSVFGAFRMWQLKKIGFHIYTTAQILLLIISKVFLLSQPFPLIPLLLASTFVLLYARNLAVMK